MKGGGGARHAAVVALPYIVSRPPCYVQAISGTPVSYFFPTKRLTKRVSRREVADGRLARRVRRCFAKRFRIRVRAETLIPWAMPAIPPPAITAQRVAMRMRCVSRGTELGDVSFSLLERVRPR